MKKIEALPEIGFLRLSSILKIFPVSKSTWWAGVKAGKFPKSIKLTKRTTAWKAEDIRELVKKTNHNKSVTNKKGTL